MTKQIDVTTEYYEFCVNFKCECGELLSFNDYDVREKECEKCKRKYSFDSNLWKAIDITNKEELKTKGVNDEISIYDRPVVITQRFEVYLKNSSENNMPIIVTRKEIRLQAHNTVCDVADTSVEYETWREVNQQDRVAVIKLIENFVRKHNER
jgi:hypothetical protein